MEKKLIEKIDEEHISYSNDDLFNISSWGADTSFRELVAMYTEGDLIKPELQRKYVWTKDEASRFIDSILLGLPVPSIFLAVDSQERRLIVDGYQRIMSVYDYINGKYQTDGKPFKLSNKEIINLRWRGKSFSQLTDEERRRIKTTTIHAIIFEQKLLKDDTGMFQIFERINTSGRTLKPQEIRNCVYQGSLNNLLFELNKDSNWRKILGSNVEDSRMNDLELILRFFAMIEFNLNDYNEEGQINLTKYLNSYMGKRRNISIEEIHSLREKFQSMIYYSQKCFGHNSFKRLKKNHYFNNKVHPITFEAVSLAVNNAIRKDYSFHEDTDYIKR